MFSEMAVGVVRKTPVILRMPSFWARWSVSVRPFWDLPVYHTGTPYVSIGITYMRYTCFQWMRSSPLMELPRMDSPRIVDLALIAIMEI